MQVLWGILDIEQPDTQTINNIVIPSVELIYSYAECLVLHGNDVGRHSVAPAVSLLKKLLFAPYEAVQTSSRSLRILYFFPATFIFIYICIYIYLIYFSCIDLSIVSAWLFLQDCSRFHFQSRLC